MNIKINLFFVVLFLLFRQFSFAQETDTTKADTILVGKNVSDTTGLDTGLVKEEITDTTGLDTSLVKEEIKQQRQQQKQEEKQVLVKEEITDTTRLDTGLVKKEIKQEQEQKQEPSMVKEKYIPQPQPRYGIQMNFIKNSTSQGVNAVASNVLKIVNNTDEAQELILNFSFPGEWNMIGDIMKAFKLNPGTKVFFPVRIIPSKFSKGNVNYAVNAVLSIKNVQIADASWSVIINKISSWKASVPLKKIYFTNNADTVSFNLRLRNTGNSDENILLSFYPDNNISFVDTALNKGFSQNIYMPVDKDTVIIYKVKRILKKDIGHDKSKKSKQEEKYSIKIIVKDNSKRPRVWNGKIDFFKLYDKLKIEEHRYLSAPLTIELNAYNVLDNPYLTIGAYGMTSLKNQRSLIYSFLSGFTSNYFDYKSYLGEQYYLGYFAPKWNIEIGNVGLAGAGAGMGTNVGGKGIKAGCKIGNHNTIQGAFVRSPDLFGNSKINGFGFNHTFNKKNFNISNYYQRRENKISKLNTNAFSTETGFRINRNNRIRLNLGVSKSHYYWDTNNPVDLFGYAYNIRYSSRIKKVAFSINNRYRSKEYIRGGGFSLSSTATYQFNKKYNLRSNYSHFENNPNMYDRTGILLPVTIHSQNDVLNLVLSMGMPKSNISVGPRVYKFKSPSLNTLTKGIRINYKLKGSKEISFRANFYGDYVKALDYNIPDFFVAQVRTFFKYKGLMGNIRYEYGPYRPYEQIKFFENKINYQKIFVLLNYNYWFNNNKFLLRSNITYNYETLFKRTMFSIRPELFYYTKSGYEFSIYSRYNLSSSGSNLHIQTYLPTTEETQKQEFTGRFEIGLGIKKEFGIPVSKRKFNTFKVIAFRDRNGNGIKDKDDQGIENMIIKIKLNTGILETDKKFSEKGYTLITNSQGTVEFINIPVGEYTVTAMPLDVMGGWFDGKTSVYIVDKDKTIYIPLSKGVRVTGGIFLKKEKYSMFYSNVNIGSIRITGIDSLGKTFSALTDGFGRFLLYLPTGKYKIMVNEAALGEDFELLQNNIPLDLNEDMENLNVSFYVIEKKRRMNIKKFDLTGNLIEPEKIQIQEVKPEEEKEIAQQIRPVKPTEKVQVVKEAKIVEQAELIKKAEVVEEVGKTGKPEEEIKPEKIALEPYIELKNKVDSLLNIIRGKEEDKDIAKQANNILNNLNIKPYLELDSKIDSLLALVHDREKEKAEFPVYHRIQKMIESVEEISKDDIQKLLDDIKKNYSEIDIDEIFSELENVETRKDSLDVLYSIKNVLDGIYTKAERPEPEVTERPEDITKRQKKVIKRPILISERLPGIVPVSEKDKKFYRIQIKSSKEKLPNSFFTGKYNVSDTVYEVSQDGIYKYSVGKFSTFNKAREYNDYSEDLKALGAFVTSYEKGKEMYKNLPEFKEIDKNEKGLFYRIQISSSIVKFTPEYFYYKNKLTQQIFVTYQDNTYKYSIKKCLTYQQAQKAIEPYRENTDFFITSYNNGKIIHISKALRIEEKK